MQMQIEVLLRACSVPKCSTRVNKTSSEEQDTDRGSLLKAQVELLKANHEDLQKIRQVWTER
jgi:hypothetical protein